MLPSHERAKLFYDQRVAGKRCSQLVYGEKPINIVPFRSSLGGANTQLPARSSTANRHRPYRDGIRRNGSTGSIHCEPPWYVSRRLKCWSAYGRPNSLSAARQGCTVVVPFREEMAKRHLKLTGDLGRVIFVVWLAPDIPDDLILISI